VERVFPIYHVNFPPLRKNSETLRSLASVKYGITASEQATKGLICGSIQFSPPVHPLERAGGEKKLTRLKTSIYEAAPPKESFSRSKGQRCNSLISAMEN